MTLVNATSCFEGLHMSSEDGLSLVVEGPPSSARKALSEWDIGIYTYNN